MASLTSATPIADQTSVSDIFILTVTPVDDALIGAFGIVSNGSQIFYEAAAKFKVNIYTQSYQDSPSVAALSDGGLEVAWDSGGQDGSNFSSIYGKRYSSSVSVIGNEFQAYERDITPVGNKSSPNAIGLASGWWAGTWTAGGGAQ